MGTIDPHTTAGLAIAGVSAAGLAIADVATGTAFFQRGSYAAWDEALTDPSTVELSELEPLADDLLSDWDDVPEDVDAWDDDDDLLISDAPAWLHSALYSDYQDAGDDDDRDDVRIPRTVLDNLEGLI